MFNRRRAQELQARLDEAERELARRTEDPIEQAIGQSVVAHIDDKRSVAGVLTTVTDNTITLEAGRLLQEGTGAIAQDGTLAIPRKRVAWYQLDIVIDDSRLQA